MSGDFQNQPNHFPFVKKFVWKQNRSNWKKNTTHLQQYALKKANDLDKDVCVCIYIYIYIYVYIASNWLLFLAEYVAFAF